MINLRAARLTPELVESLEDVDLLLFFILLAALAAFLSFLAVLAAFFLALDEELDEEDVRHLPLHELSLL